jgi:hypothetical protein
MNYYWKIYKEEQKGKKHINIMGRDQLTVLTDKKIFQKMEKNAYINSGKVIN